MIYVWQMRIISFVLLFLLLAYQPAHAKTYRVEIAASDPAASYSTECIHISCRVDNIKIIRSGMEKRLNAQIEIHLSNVLIHFEDEEGVIYTNRGGGRDFIFPYSSRLPSEYQSYLYLPLAPMRDPLERGGFIHPVQRYSDNLIAKFAIVVIPEDN